MTDLLRVKCPFCEGHGEMLPSEIETRYGTPERKNEFDARVTEILGEHAAVTGTRNFEKEVHTWNPQVPMWRRSPKE